MCECLKVVETGFYYKAMKNEPRIDDPVMAGSNCQLSGKEAVYESWSLRYMRKSLVLLIFHFFPSLPGNAIQNQIPNLPPLIHSVRSRSFVKHAHALHGLSRSNVSTEMISGNSQQRLSLIIRSQLPSEAVWLLKGPAHQMPYGLRSISLSPMLFSNPVSRFGTASLHIRVCLQTAASYDRSFRPEQNAVGMHGLWVVGMEAVNPGHGSFEIVRPWPSVRLMADNVPVVAVALKIVYVVEMKIPQRKTWCFDDRWWWISHFGPVITGKTGCNLDTFFFFLSIRFFHGEQ
jgi:hypothetical protein